MLVSQKFGLLIGQIFKEKENGARLMNSVSLLSSVIIVPLFTARPANAQAAGKPNIVLVMADDQGWGDMAYNGHPVVKTPNFDAMAKEAVRFDQFHAAAPVCWPTPA